LFSKHRRQGKPESPCKDQTKDRCLRKKAGGEVLEARQTASKEKYDEIMQEMKEDQLDHEEFMEGTAKVLKNAEDVMKETDTDLANLNEVTENATSRLRSYADKISENLNFLILPCTEFTLIKSPFFNFLLINKPKKKLGRNKVKAVIKEIPKIIPAIAKIIISTRFLMPSN